METFRYRAQQKDGKIINAIITAENAEAAAVKLRASDLLPIEIRKTRTRSKKARLRLNDARDLSALLALLLDSGHTLPDSLLLICEGTSNTRITNACRVWAEDLDHGYSFKQALANPSVQVPSGFQSLAGIGDSVGALDSVLKRLEDYFTRLSKLRESLGTALVYPVLVLVVAVIAFVFIGTFILPRLNELMATLDSSFAVPETRQFGSSLFILALILLISVFFLIPNSTEFGRLRSKWLVKIPFIGSFIKDWQLLNWSFALEVLLGGGIPMKSALAEASDTITNPYFRTVMDSVSVGIEKGLNLSTILFSIKDVPKVVTTWVSIGEKTGRDEEVFKPLRRYFEDKVGRTIDLATQLVEPVFIILLGVAMVFFVIKYLLPLFQMMGNIL